MAGQAIDQQPLYVLAISSYAVHGVASLKTFIKISGSAILPVPSLMLSGLTNIPGIKKFETPFEELLESTLEIAANRKQQLIFYTGYLGSQQQSEIVVRMIKKYSTYIKAVITDPVCGDNGKTYVGPGVISSWPEIIKISDWAFPNATELRLITGHNADAPGPIDLYIQRFKEMYPRVKLVISSYPANDHQTGVQLHDGASFFEYYLPLLSQNFSGSGDLLTALFIRNHYYHHLPKNDALKQATNQTYQILKFSMDSGSDEILLNEQFYNHITILNQPDE